jgi:hypothetical protein
MPVAPPVYRPQPVPKVLQTKKPVVPQSSAAQIGGTKKPAAPPPRQGTIVGATLRGRPSVKSYDQGIMQGRPQRAAPTTTVMFQNRPSANLKPLQSHQIARPPAPAHTRPVIQPKGKLKVIKTADIPKTSEVRAELLQDYRHSRYVDMYWRGVSDGQPLYSDSFGNCMAVVIHNQDRDYGAMMHINPAAIGATDTDTVIYAVNKELRKIASWNSYTGGKLELFLGKGISWTPIGNNQLAPNFSYSEYLAEKHKGRFTNIIDMLDSKGFSLEFAMLYVPKKGVIYLLDQETELELNRVKKDDHSIADSRFAKIEERRPGYYQKLQEAKKAKRERIEKFISELGHLNEKQLSRLLEQNRGPKASEELEKAAIYLLQKKQNPTREPLFPKIRIYDSL